MPTFNDSAAPNNATDAEFRAWAQVVHDCFDLSGWVQTGDTGQIDLTTVAAPLAGNTQKGYELWGMDDALQATSPVYVKVWYGSGTSTNRPGIWFEFGEGTSGTGLLTGRLYNGRPPSGGATEATCQAASNSASVSNVYGGGDVNRIVLGLFEPVNDNATGNRMLFCIERMHDADGSDNADGILFACSSSGTLSRFGAFRFGVYNNQPIQDSIYVACSGAINTPLGQAQIHAAYIHLTSRFMLNKMSGLILVAAWNPGWTSFSPVHAAGEARGEFVHDTYEGTPIDYRSFGMNVSLPTSQSSLFPALRYE